MPKRNSWILLTLISLGLLWHSPEVVVASALAGQVDITTPKAGETLSGEVLIQGNAFIEPADTFKYYKLEYADNLEQPGWIQLRRSGQAVMNGVLASWDTTLLYNGQYYLRLTAVDKIGNFIQSDPLPVMVDNGPDAPLWPDPVELDTPVDGASVQRRVSIAGTVTTQFADLPAFDYYKLEYSPGPAFNEWHLIGGLERRERVRSRLGTWETSDLPNGRYALRAQLVFFDGNYLERQIFVTVDNPPPPQETRVEIIEPADGAVVSRRVKIDGYAALAADKYDFGVYKLYYGQGREPNDWTPIQVSNYPVVNDRFKTWDVGRLPNGPYTLYLTVKDATGNFTLEDRVLVTVENPPPPTETVVKIAEPEAGATIERKVQIIATAALDSTQYEFGSYTLEYGQGRNPTEWLELASDHYPEIDARFKAWDVSELSNGPYTLRLTVQDVGGEVIGQDLVTFSVENPLPPQETRVEIVAPQAGEELTGRVKILGTAALDARQYDFGNFVVAYGRGRNPTAWTELGQSRFPEIESRLATWDVRGVANGEYTVRLTAQDASGNTIKEDRIPIIVKNPPPPAQTTVAITSLTAGQVISGTVKIVGSAALAADQYEFGSYRLEYGQGRNPEEWVLLKTDAYPEVDNRLVLWDVRALDDGLYTVRLVVSDKSGELTLKDSVVVQVQN